MKRILFLLLPFLILMGCSSGKKSNQTGEIMPEMINSVLSNSPWVLSILNGKLIHAQMERNPYMKFDGKSVTGNAGCNTFNGDYSTQGDRGLTFGALISTKMACSDLVIENTFMKALHDTRSYLIKADTLILLNADKTALVKLLSVADLKE